VALGALIAADARLVTAAGAGAGDERSTWCAQDDTSKSACANRFARTMHI
jgi:hypothetical protein